MHFSFYTVDSTKLASKLIDFLIYQNNNYPKYEDWVLRARKEILDGYKKAILAESDGKIVGDIIYQPHKTMSRIREIKNMRIHPSAEGKGFARFLLKQVELDTQDCDMLTLDVRANQTKVINVLEKVGYKKITAISLYDEQPDIIMTKPIRSIYGQISTGIF